MTTEPLPKASPIDRRSREQRVATIPVTAWIRVDGLRGEQKVETYVAPGGWIEDVVNAVSRDRDIPAEEITVVSVAPRAAA